MRVDWPMTPRKVVRVDNSVDCVIAKRVNRFVVEVVIGGRRRTNVSNTRRLV
nr:hypothetical protein [Candidatus Freyrarchaeum guaymaensis]